MALSFALSIYFTVGLLFSVGFWTVIIKAYACERSEGTLHAIQEELNTQSAYLDTLLQVYPALILLLAVFTAIIWPIPLMIILLSVVKGLISGLRTGIRALLARRR